MHDHESTVLIVDDSASVRTLVELTLRRSGFSVISAASGVAALAMLAETHPDLILIDATLGWLDGFQLCRIVRNHPDYAQTPIIIMSGHESASNRQTVTDAGGDAWITRPFKPDELARTARELLLRRSEVRIS